MVIWSFLSISIGHTNYTRYSHVWQGQRKWKTESLIYFFLGCNIFWVTRNVLQMATEHFLGRCFFKDYRTIFSWSLLLLEAVILDQLTGLADKIVEVPIHLFRLSNAQTYSRSRPPLQGIYPQPVLVKSMSTQYHHFPRHSSCRSSQCLVLLTAIFWSKNIPYGNTQLVSMNSARMMAFSIWMQ